MLIVLSESLRDSDLHTPLVMKARDALINLSIATYSGKHLVTGSKRIFADLQKVALDPGPAGHFKASSAYIDDAQGFREEALAYIQVQPIGYPARVETLSTSKVAHQLVFHVPLDHFTDSERAGCSYIIDEHLRDANIYLALGEAYATFHRGFRCVMFLIDGHGGATPQTFELFADQGRSILCIVDSDRSSPEASLGRTAADAHTSHQTTRTRGKVASVHILPCRELENLLPAALVVEALPGDLQSPLRLKVLAHQDKLGKADFVDLKDLVKLDPVYECLARSRPHERAKLCFSPDAHAAIREIGALVWSFGLASRRIRV